ncbi:hypothetical protein [Paludibacter sp.]|uniref:hypothetical protein n=1 Tax=Paludibacter sp. TaxID=1898105 RepID=UPI001354C107|nr:hypothetical protein [Paludibacter sp.]MTK54476.1 hypothetical protein [Paludibacter sp.]
MKKLLFFFSIILVIGCSRNSATSNSRTFSFKKVYASSTISNTLKSQLEYDCYLYDNVQLNDRAYFWSKHKDEILNSLVIPETSSVPDKNLTLVFYKFSVGQDTIYKTAFMKKIDGKWYIHNEYFQKFADDPFKNGHGVEGKLLLYKAFDWEYKSQNIWWK